MKSLVMSLAAGVALWTSGCASLFEDNLDRAYKSGNLSGGEYYRLKAQQDAARRREMFLQQEASGAAERGYVTVHEEHQQYAYDADV